jgi:hypothetical protein
MIQVYNIHEGMRQAYKVLYKPEGKKTLWKQGMGGEQQRGPQRNRT